MANSSNLMDAIGRGGYAAVSERLELALDVLAME